MYSGVVVEDDDISQSLALAEPALDELLHRVTNDADFVLNTRASSCGVAVTVGLQTSHALDNEFVPALFAAVFERVAEQFLLVLQTTVHVGLLDVL